MEGIEIRSINFVTINGAPLYRVMYWNDHILADGTETGRGNVLIGAKDGRLYDDYGELVTT